MVATNDSDNPDLIVTPEGKAAQAASLAGLTLARDSKGLFLSDGTMRVQGDFARLLPRLKPGSIQRELLVKACKVKGLEGTPLAVDATAGLGDDSLLLAAAGFKVLLFERNPVIAALLADALQRASADPKLAPIAARMQLEEGDSQEALPHLPVQPDVVVLDPMFPAKHGDARAKKKLQLLQALEQPCEAEEALLEAAFSTRPHKVVVKRPLKGPFLANRKPSYSLKGTTIRYDVHVLAR